MKTVPGPAMSRRTWLWGFPQKVHEGAAPPSPRDAMPLGSLFYESRSARSYPENRFLPRLMVISYLFRQLMLV
jgi:hypothetical protein